jgi:hypothetical protein
VAMGELDLLNGFNHFLQQKIGWKKK